MIAKQYADEGKHQWNSCGSEAGKDERKQTGSRVQTNRKDFMGNQGERKGEPEKRKRKRRYPRSHREARRGKFEKEERKAE